ncbi:hypothetical protein PoB_002379900 [Plakobranchus ocellatus]|uniref:Uncharacterized protein n=1 Tax=Plakobranchus ocellatus TaxID=259542 RepID=A0AAV3ZSB7_9GAST|nr:hypothetical protein PoB_002379900 [Plakobranchus ocellatus]
MLLCVSVCVGVCVKRARLELDPGVGGGPGLSEPCLDTRGGIPSPGGSSGGGEDAGSTIGPGSTLDSSIHGHSQDNGHSTLSGLTPSSTPACSSSPINDGLSSNGNYLSAPQTWLMNCSADAESICVKSAPHSPSSPVSVSSTSDGSHTRSTDTPSSLGESHFRAGQRTSACGIDL